MGKRRKWSAEAKFEIALLALKGETTLNEICKRYEVAPSQVHLWKKQLLDQGAQLFGKPDKVAVAAADVEKQQRKLFEKIGQLTVERDFLKKSWSKLHGNGDDN
jgi:transposase